MDSWLIAEERLLRIAMLCLHHGTFSELTSLGISPSFELISHMELDAPLFSISSRLSSFH